MTPPVDAEVVAARDEASAARRGIRQLLPRMSLKLALGLIIVVGDRAVRHPRAAVHPGPDATPTTPRLSPPSAEHLLGTTKLG